MEVSEARRLKYFEDENRKLKKRLAEQMLDNSTLKEMLGKTFEAWYEEKRRGLGLVFIAIAQRSPMISSFAKDCVI